MWISGKSRIWEERSLNVDMSINFDFRAGDHCLPEVIQGELLIQATAIGNIMLNVQLPLGTRHQIIDGRTTVANIGASPDGPMPDWAYKVIVLNLATNSRISWLLGVPASTVDLDFRTLPIYETVLAGNATVGGLLSWSTDVTNHAELYERTKLASKPWAGQARNVTDSSLDHLQSAYESGGLISLGEKNHHGTVSSTTRISINVLDPQYGVSGDGVTDDTHALTAIRNTLAALGGGTIIFPPTQYHLSGYLELFDNLTIVGYGATLLKLETSTHQASFVGKSNGASGYGSGARNIKITGIKLRGSFKGNKGNGVAMHHVENIEFRNVTFEECLTTGHAADLGGCRLVRFINCTFAGWKVTQGREYTEAIQCDYSTAATVGLDTEPTSFDGLPSVNVVVEACQFTPLTIDGTTYPAPNPIGSHSRVEGHLLEDIHFVRNVVRGGQVSEKNLGAASMFHTGWIHLGYGRGFKINGNRFVAMHSTPTRVININTPVSAYRMSSVSDPMASMVASEPVPVENFEFIDNEFIGFMSTDSEARLDPLIEVSGSADISQENGFRFSGTKFSGCSSAIVEQYAGGN